MGWETEVNMIYSRLDSYSLNYIAKIGEFNIIIPVFQFINSMLWASTKIKGLLNE